jgi:hypothetical protein
MLRDLEHPSVTDMNRKGYLGLAAQSEHAGLDYFGSELLPDDDVAIDGDVIILKDNLERYLYDVYGITFKTIE